MSEPGTTIPLCEPVIGEPDIKGVLRCLQSGFVSSVGPLVSEFEKAFAEFTGSKYAVATASGTAALHVALKTLNINAASSVAVSDLTFVASVNPALYCGAAPLLCDSEYTTWGMDPEILDHLAARMKREGRAIGAVIPVHLFGRACRMDLIMEAARRHGIPVIEDATESLGTSLHGRHTGTWGEIGCYSFNGNKLMTTGAGGMIVTDSRLLADRARHLVNQARSQSDRFIHSEPGFNYRMSNLAASLGLAQLQRIDEFIRRKREIAAAYTKAFCTVPGIELPSEQAGENSSFWLYSILAGTSAQRESLLNGLNEAGIQARRFFEPLHRQPYLEKAVWTMHRGDLTAAESGITDDLAGRGINLPSSVSLSLSDQQRVIDATRSILHRKHSGAPLSGAHSR